MQRDRDERDRLNRRLEARADFAQCANRVKDIKWITAAVVREATAAWEKYEFAGYKSSPMFSYGDEPKDTFYMCFSDYGFMVQGDGEAMAAEIRSALEGDGVIAKYVHVADAEQWYGGADVHFGCPTLKDFVRRPGGFLSWYVKDLKVVRKANGIMVTCKPGWLARLYGNVRLLFHVADGVAEHTCPVPAQHFGVGTSSSPLTDTEVGVRVVHGAAGYWLASGKVTPEMG